MDFMSTRTKSIFKDPNIAKYLSHLHDKYGVAPADKTVNNNVFVCTYERGNPGQS
jgi:hypothetical protein